MNDDQFDDLKQFIDGRISQSAENTQTDLKQFIETRISQSETRLTGDLTKKIKDVEENLKQEMRAGFEGVGDATEQIHTQLSDHQTRITALEDAAAA
jgi:hypothetical protein